MCKKLISISLALLAAVLVTLLAACGGEPEEETGTPSDMDAPTISAEGLTVTEGLLTVGFDTEFPPMGFEDDNGDFVGFDLDCAKAVAERLGLEVKLQPIVWDSKDAELESRTIDLLWDGFIMHVEDRDGKYTWSEPYMKNNQVIVVLDASEYRASADLVGKNIAVQSGSSADAAIKSHEAFYNSIRDNVTLCESSLAALENLKAGLVDAVVMDSVVASYISARQAGIFRLLDEILAEEEYGVGFLKGNTALRDAVGQALTELAADGTLAGISRKWFGEDIVLIGK